MWILLLVYWGLHVHILSVNNKLSGIQLDSHSLVRFMTWIYKKVKKKPSNLDHVTLDLNLIHITKVQPNRVSGSTHNNAKFSLVLEVWQENVKEFCILVSRICILSACVSPAGTLCSVYTCQDLVFWHDPDAENILAAVVMMKTF